MSQLYADRTLITHRYTEKDNDNDDHEDDDDDDDDE